MLGQEENETIFCAYSNNSGTVPPCRFVYVIQKGEEALSQNAAAQSKKKERKALEDKRKMYVYVPPRRFVYVIQKGEEALSQNAGTRGE